MEAYFDRTNHPKVKIIVGGRKQKRLLIALLDTGFDGHLSIPINIAIQLGLELVNVERVQYADGRISSELVFAVNVEIDGKNQLIQATLTNSIEALAGTALFSKNKVTFDFLRRKIIIT